MPDQDTRYNRRSSALAYGLPALGAPNAQASDKNALSPAMGGGTPGIPSPSDMARFIQQRQASGNASPRAGARTAIAGRKPKLPAGGTPDAAAAILPPPRPLRDTTPRTVRDLAALYSMTDAGRELRRAAEGRV
jgi:hypothetical protein